MYFRLEVADKDKVGDGELGMVEKVVESTGKAQVFGQFGVESLVPVGRWRVPAGKRVETGSAVGGKAQVEERYAVVIKLVPSAVAQSTPQVLTVGALHRMQLGIVVAEKTTSLQHNVVAISPVLDVVPDKARPVVHIAQSVDKSVVESYYMGQ